MPIGKGWLDDAQDISEDECNIRDLATELLKEKLSEIFAQRQKDFEKFRRENNDN